MGFFLLDTLKTIFWIEYLTEKWTLSGAFFPQNQGTFCDFQKAPPPPTLVARLVFDTLLLI